MENNYERKMTKRHHSFPLEFLMVAVLLLINFNAYPQESMKFDNEAKKLEFIRQMLAKEKYLRLSEYSAPHCKPMMEDLLANKNFKAIEPDVRADSVDDPRMAKWKQCEHKDYHDYNVDVKNFFDWLDALGAPPYRYYRIDLDGNKANGLEDMIYYNQPIDPNRLKQGDTGYTWVDLDNCERKDGFPATGWMTNTSDKPNAIYLNTLVYYKGKLWAVDFVDGFGFSLMRWLDRERMETCYWRLFKRE
ncbi:MAG: hypothetical protein ACXU9K_11225 [Thermodesulfobacteriota bacterium]